MLDKLHSCVEKQYRLMSSHGLLDARPEVMGRGGAAAEGGDAPPPSRELLQQLQRRAQLWPLMEELAVLNQLRLSTDLLQLALTQG